VLTADEVSRMDERELFTECTRRIVELDARARAARDAHGR